MKECVYGWYPPARNVWKEYRNPPSTYDLDSLYKFTTSSFIEQSLMLSPENFRITPSPRPPSKRTASHHHSGSPFPPPPTDRTESHAYHADERPAVPHGGEEVEIPARSQSKHSSAYRRPVTVSAVVYASPAEYAAMSNTEYALPPRPPSSASKRSRSAAGGKRASIPLVHRVQSSYGTRSPACQVPSFTPIPSHTVADVPQVAPTSRPTSRGRSAASVRTPLADIENRESPGTQYRGRSIRSASVNRPAPSTTDQVETRRPKTAYARETCTDVPEVKKIDVIVPTEQENMSAVGADQSECITGPQREGGTEDVGWLNQNGGALVNYEEQLQKYGWRMEIPGDPLHLKRQCIPQRQSFSTVIPRSVLPEDFHVPHYQSTETFFYNTIPNRRATFDINQDFASELVIAKRKELQKRDGGIKYRYKNFSFVY